MFSKQCICIELRSSVQWLFAEETLNDNVRLSDPAQQACVIMIVKLVKKTKYASKATSSRSEVRDCLLSSGSGKRMSKAGIAK